jgi:hypothetical protein
MSDILGVGQINGTTNDTPVKPAAPAGAAAPAKEISRSDLILLVQKLQKRSAAAEQQVLALKKQIAEQTTQPASTDPNNLIDLLSCTPATAAASSKEDSGQLAKQAAIHASQLANLQAELKARNESIETLNRTVTDTRKELAKARANAAPSPSSTPPLPNGSPSSASPAPAQQSGGSFLLENANKELRASLAAEQSKVQATEKRTAQLQARLEKVEADLLTASKQAGSQTEGVQKRVSELETKLAMSDSKLMKSFQLIEGEKKKVDLSNQELEKLNKKIKELNQAVASSSSLLQESHQSLQHEKQALESLRSENFRLLSKLESIQGEGEGDLREFRKTLQSKDETIVSLQNELDHLRSIHAHSINSLEDEFSRLTKQYEIELEQEKSASERAQTEGQQEKFELKQELERTRRELFELKEYINSTKQENSNALEQFERQKIALEELKQAYEKLQQQYTDSTTSHFLSLQELDDSSKAKYARLVSELKSYRIYVIQEHTALKNELDESRRLIAELREEISQGKPGERRIWELAQLQSSRNELVRELEEELRREKTQNLEWKQKIEQTRIEKEFLLREVQSAKESRSRSSIDTDYLKSVLVEFIKSEGNQTKKSQLVPVLSQLLRFTPEDLEVCKQSLHDADVSSGFWSKLTSLASVIPGAPAADAAKKKVFLPPTIPIGIELEHHSSPFAATPSSSQQQQLPTHGASSSLSNVDLTGAVAVQSP